MENKEENKNIKYDIKIISIIVLLSIILVIELAQSIQMRKMYLVKNGVDICKNINEPKFDNLHRVHREIFNDLDNEIQQMQRIKEKMIKDMDFIMNDDFIDKEINNFERRNKKSLNNKFFRFNV